MKSFSCFFINIEISNFLSIEKYKGKKISLDLVYLAKNLFIRGCTRFNRRLSGFGRFCDLFGFRSFRFSVFSILFVVIIFNVFNSRIYHVSSWKLGIEVVGAGPRLLGQSGLSFGFSLGRETAALFKSGVSILWFTQLKIYHS